MYQSTNDHTQTRTTDQPIFVSAVGVSAWEAKMGIQNVWTSWVNSARANEINGQADLSLSRLWGRLGL